MKKFLVIIAVLALTMVSSVAMAEVTVDGSVEFLMRSFKNTTDWNDATTGCRRLPEHLLAYAHRREREDRRCKGPHPARYRLGSVG